MMKKQALSSDFALYQFARYMAGRYRLGYDYLALYWASVLFENIIDRKIKNQDSKLYARLTSDWKENTLDNKINLLSAQTLEQDSVWKHRGPIFKTYLSKQRGRVVIPHPTIRKLDDVRQRLLNFKFLRNRIMHDSSINIEDEKPNNKDEFIYYVWSELAPDSFESQLAKFRAGSSKRLIDTLYKTTADYMVRAVDETMQVEHAVPFQGISRCDFDDMFLLRDKLLGLKMMLTPWLAKHADFLTTDILTTIDTTSGYIWMPLVPSRLKADGKRKGIFNCSVSLLATTLELRIYMDFGGQAPRKLRANYFNFLASKEYLEFLNDMPTHDELCIFDIDWFSALFNPRTSVEWLQERSPSIKAAWEKVAAATEVASSPITWNRMLHGYRLSKFDLKEDGKISFTDIEPKLRNIIHLYQAFNEYRKDTI
jgi:hypothetical protein